ncbi:hypothetical protein CR513_09503, partial [Mucuna pruriens]
MIAHIERVFSTHIVMLQCQRCMLEAGGKVRENWQVTKQVILAFVLGKYEDKVLCDVVPIEATHILLGRIWKYDWKVTHDEITNKFTFVHRG